MPDCMTITAIKAHHGDIRIYYSSNYGIYAWLENSNKHLPNIYELSVNVKSRYICVSISELEDILKSISPDDTLKLSASTENESIAIAFSDEIAMTDRREYGLVICSFDKQGNLTFRLNYIYEADVPTGAESELSETTAKYMFGRFPDTSTQPCTTRFANGGLPAYCATDTGDSSIIRPIDVLVWGSCYVRSVFRSEPYFNRNYKKFFNVVYTVFHTSFISAMSSPVRDNSYKNMRDLLDPSVYRYIECEFEKNIIDVIKASVPKYIIVDNYIDAVAPVIEMACDSYLTYNKYFSESIYKRKFSGCRILYPGTPKHIELYRMYIMRFADILRTNASNIKIILLGGRLCRYKYDSLSCRVQKWSDKMEWITNSNYSWEIADEIFLDTFPKAHYIDMRNTHWMSDIHSPIVGGASPSHYHSGYYREVFYKILKICRENCDLR